ncbi:hypothetical protein [Mycobacterium sp. MS1601]|uniref:hypothetical protein n=1 Tax=Mycobacterium sp. MS1601 TaxID=1936029 RepID=UPI001F18767A|nr:hypothetical protein [Mycobacterium sp. MS1601]
MVHHDTVESVALVIGADRNPFDVAGVNDNTTVVPGPGHDSGERYEGLTIDEGHVHAMHGVQPNRGGESWVRTRCAPTPLRD